MKKKNQNINCIHSIFKIRGDPIENCRLRLQNVLTRS